MRLTAAVPVAAVLVLVALTAAGTALPLAEPRPHTDRTMKLAGAVVDPALAAPQSLAGPGAVLTDVDLMWVCHMSPPPPAAAGPAPLAEASQYTGTLVVAPSLLPMLPNNGGTHLVVAWETPNVGRGEPSNGTIQIHVENDAANDTRPVVLDGTWAYTTDAASPIVLSGFVDGVGSVTYVGVVTAPAKW